MNFEDQEKWLRLLNENNQLSVKIMNEKFRIFYKNKSLSKIRKDLSSIFHKLQMVEKTIEKKRRNI